MINLTRVRKVLREICFNPKKDRRMLIMTQVGNREYYERRAIELLMSKPGRKEIIIIIRLLVILLCEVDENNEAISASKEKKSRKANTDSNRKPPKD